MYLEWNNIRCYRWIHSISAILISLSLASGQSCQLPILSSFANATQASVEMQWLDFNNDVLSYQIEFGVKGFSPTGVPDRTGISQKFFTLGGLESGTAYELYLRSECPSGFSGWNGPYFFNTVIDNGSGCGIALDIQDNRCPLSESFEIEVSGYNNLTLGRDVVLEKVELLISHPWPPDLSIELWSPFGEMTILSQHNGNGSDNYGDRSLSACSGAFQFSDNACESIADFAPPFVGIVKPETPLSDLYSDNSPDGTWELRVCDRANGDLGVLEYLNLSFIESACIIPPSLSIADVEADNITVVWENDFDCQSLELAYKIKDDPIQLTFSEIVLCSAGSFTIPNLQPDEAYEMIVTAQCGVSSSSPESCIFPFRTTCANSTLRESFDGLDNCQSACDVDCDWTGLWKNDPENQSDWLVNRGPTPTSFTGPESDVSGDGNYVYIENQIGQCAESSQIILVSDCLTKPANTECALSFSYNMLGQDIGQLSVEYSVDSLVWNTVWALSGDQGSGWNSATLEIPIIFERGLIRFVGDKLESATRGDMAIDNIKLIGIDTIEPQQFFVDADLDGFGNSDQPIFVCSSNLLEGFATLDGDCDDGNPQIFPGATEILCNQIDENCNGDEDDSEESNIGFILGDIRNASCLGQANGAVTIQAINGQPPYSYAWSGGQTSAAVSNLEAGVHFCTITDVGGCQLVSEPIIVDYDDILVYSVRRMEAPSCFGRNDGLIELLIEGGTPPYSVDWNSGDRGSLIGGLVDGSYTATISDNGFCSVVIDSLNLKGPDIITGGVVLKRNNSCFEDSTGFIQLGIFGGTSPYDILWNTGETSSIINGLAAGSYSATITDQNRCVDIVEDVLIDQPLPLSISLNNIENISCFNENESLIDINVTGGTAPYGYFWSDGSNLPDLINQKAGDYVLTVTDVNACTAVSEIFTISQPEPITAFLDSIVNVNCAGSDDGFLEIGINGGVGPFAYNWNLQDGQSGQANSLNSLTSGSYSVTIVDAFDCKSDVFSFEVANQNIPIDIQASMLDAVACFGDSTGRITARALNGNLPLDYNWSSGEKVISAVRMDTIDGLIAGTYNLTITDSEGCIGISDSVTVTQSTLITSTITKADNLCWNGTEGTAQISVEGGTAPYQIIWSDGQMGINADSLSNGMYEASIVDDFGCSTLSNPVSIFSPDTLRISATVLNPSLGEGGAISLDVEGGIAPYFYNWPPPFDQSVSASITDIPVGTYPVSIEDQNGCMIDTVFVLETSAVGEAEKEGFKFYPNPFTNFLKIEGPKKLAAVEIFSLEGRRLLIAEDLSDNIDVTTIPTGLYYVRCTLKNGRNLYSSLLTKL